MKRKPARQMIRDGYVLAEALAAFAILALGLAALFAAIGGAVRADRHADFQQAAVLVAQSRLAALGLSDSLEEGITTGQTPEGMAWTLEISAYDIASARQRPRAFWARVTVQGAGEPKGQGQQLVLTSLKLQRPRTGLQP